tara:strand:- start:14826 stop:17060 length:2235 start_codon:yes stop_codon:yes gene_type:complete
MLINATQPEELRVALVDGQSIYDFDIEQSGQERKKSNIYKAKISRIEQSLGAAFVDFGSERHGFLPVKELAPSFLKSKQGKNAINDCLTQGQEIIVQVEKEERGNKGAALSTFISLPGHYLVLMPNNPEAGGISKSIEGKSREEMRDKLRTLNSPDGMGVILRTAGEGVSIEELQWDLDYLLNLWDAIQEANQLRKAPFLIFRENDLVSRSLRDFLRDDITEVLIDTDDAYEKAYDFTSKLLPDFEDKIKRYDEAIPLFTRYQIESQIETAYQRDVGLPSGGSIVIDQTEALVAIDINSAKATGGSDIEETALNTNLEAALEIGKQLRLRDIGGLVVIDFIDMLSLKNKRAVEDKLWAALSIDRAKVQVGRISRFGLMEMSRQRLRPSLQERWTQDVASLSTAVLRLIEEEGSKKKSGEVRAIVSPDMSTFLLNERRSRINEIEERTNVRVVVVSDPTRSDNRFEVTRLRSDDKNSQDSASYEIQDEIKNKANSDSNYKKTSFEKPAVNLTPPKKPKRKGDGFIKRILKSFTEADATNKPKPKKKSNQKRKKNTDPKRQINKSSQDNRKKQAQKRESSKSRHKNDLSKKEVQNNKDKNRNGNKKKLSSPKPNIKKPQNKKLKEETKPSSIKKDPNLKKVNLNISTSDEVVRDTESKDVSKSSVTKKEAKHTNKNLKKSKPVDSSNNNESKDKNNESKGKNKETFKSKTDIENKDKKDNKKLNEVAVQRAAKDWGRASNDPRNKG